MTKAVPWANFFNIHGGGMTSKERIASQLFGMRKVRVEFHLDDDSVHAGWVVGWSQKSGQDRVSIKTERL